MAKTIVLNWEDKEYTLEYTRESASQTERDGLRIQQIEELPITMIPALVHGAFLAHHPYTKPELIDEIYANVENKDEFLKNLSEMYAEVLTTLFDKPKKKSGNLNWKANW